MEAEKERNRENKKPKAKKERPEARRAAAKEHEEKRSGSNLVTYLIIVVVIALILCLFYFVATNYISTPFSTFKSNFISAPRVAVVVGYSSDAQRVNETPCFTNMIQYIATTRNASTIDFFIINQSNETCIYSPTGLGHQISIATKSANSCLSVARSEPSVFLNYSGTNYTMITLSHLYIYADSGYLASCPIATELG
jgi:uncharacterized integral membrane protein